MILVTGAAGKTGKAVIQALIARGEPLRAFVHREEQSATLTSLGVEEIIVGDLLDRSTVEYAVQDVEAIYHICPNVSPHEFTIGKLVISTAQSAGAGHFVYHSVLHPQTEAMPHHWLKLRVEEYLLKSGLPFSILQPTAYMQNVLAHWDTIIEQGIYPVPYSENANSSLVDLFDVAEVAAIVLTEGVQHGATYELVGVNAITPGGIAKIISEQLGRDVQVREIPVEVWETGARNAGLGEYQIETLKKMFAYYDRYGFQGNSNVLTWLLGRYPTSLETFIQEQAKLI